MRRQDIADYVERHAHEDFARAGGPGGQNVNKVNTKVTLRVPLDDLPVEPMRKSSVVNRLGKRVNESGELVLQSGETRSQAKNRVRAKNRAIKLLAGALEEPRKRRKTAPSPAAKERRLEAKRRRAQIKRSRREPGE